MIHGDNAGWETVLGIKPNARQLGLAGPGLLRTCRPAGASAKSHHCLNGIAPCTPEPTHCGGEPFCVAGTRVSTDLRAEIASKHLTSNFIARLITSFHATRSGASKNSDPPTSSHRPSSLASHRFSETHPGPCPVISPSSHISESLTPWEPPETRNQGITHPGKDGGGHNRKRGSEPSTPHPRRPWCCGRAASRLLPRSAMARRS